MAKEGYATMIPPCRTCKWMKYHGWRERLFGRLGLATCRHPEIGPLRTAR